MRRVYLEKVPCTECGRPGGRFVKKPKGGVHGPDALGAPFSTACWGHGLNWNSLWPFQLFELCLQHAEEKLGWTLPL